MEAPFIDRLRRAWRTGSVAAPLDLGPRHDAASWELSASAPSCQVSPGAATQRRFTDVREILVDQHV
jgi:hypothetical protein